MIDPKKIEEWTRLASPVRPDRIDVWVTECPGEPTTVRVAPDALAFWNTACEAVPALIAERESIRSALFQRGSAGRLFGQPCCAGCNCTGGHAPACFVAMLLEMLGESQQREGLPPLLPRE